MDMQVNISEELKKELEESEISEKEGIKENLLRMVRQNKGVTDEGNSKQRFVFI